MRDNGREQSHTAISFGIVWTNVNRRTQTLCVKQTRVPFLGFFNSGHSFSTTSLPGPLKSVRSALTVWGCYTLSYLKGTTLSVRGRVRISCLSTQKARFLWPRKRPDVHPLQTIIFGHTPNQSWQIIMASSSCPGFHLVSVL